LIGSVALKEQNIRNIHTAVAEVEQVEPASRIYKYPTRMDTKYKATIQSFVVQDGVPSEPPLTAISSAEFMQKMPRGVYTSMRTFHQKNIVEFDAHVNRLSESLDLMLEELNSKPNQERGGHELEDIKLEQALDSVSLTSRLATSTCEALEGFMNEHADSITDDSEFKVTALMIPTTDENAQSHRSSKLYCHVQPLQTRWRSPIIVKVAGLHRKNPHMKDSQWAEQRKVLFEGKTDPRGPTHEVILPSNTSTNNDGLVTSKDKVLQAHDLLLFEGGSTNVFVLTQDNVLVTAEEGILKGTVRKIVLEAAHRLCESGILNGVELRAPSLAEALESKSLFLTSTSRVILPVDILLIEGIGDDQGRDFEQGEDNVLHRLRVETSKMLFERSKTVVK